MALQKSVSFYPVLGFPGQQVVPNQAVYVAANLMTDGTAQSGGFVFTKASDGITLFTKTSTAGAVPVGIVERLMDNIMPDVTDNATVTYPAGQVLTVAIRGQYYIKAPSAGTSGHKILIKPTDGTISFAAAVPSSNDDGLVDTGWIVLAPEGAASFVEGDLVIAQNFG